MDIDWHSGSRAQLRSLFELAEDSPQQLDDYIGLGRILVARIGARIVGHLQLIPMVTAGEIELKNMAAAADAQGDGLGRALVGTALARCGEQDWARMLVATAAADTGNLCFYQRLGFRLLAVERDAFTPVTGYPDPILIDGIALRDRVWLSQDLTRDAGPREAAILRTVDPR